MYQTAPGGYSQKKWVGVCGPLLKTLTLFMARMMDSMPSDWLYCSKLNPSCLCYDSKPAKLHKARWAIQLLNHLLGLPNRTSSRFFQEQSSTVTFILRFFSYRNVNRVNSSFFTELKAFLPKIQRWYRFHLHDARLLAGDLNFDLTFVTRNCFGSCVIRCAFWLASKKDDCLERVLKNLFASRS